jgi:hypothetical protein
MFEILEPFQNLIKKFESQKISTERAYISFTQKKSLTQDGVPDLMFYMHIISLKITGLLHELNHYPP